MSDPHFGHRNILKFARSMFETVEEHNQYLLERINETVGMSDQLFILGDIAFNSEYWHLAAINCQNITIVLGNHDYPSKLKSIQEMIPGVKIAGALEHTFKGTGKSIIMTHIPVHPSQLQHRGDRPPRYAANVHGHLHQFTVDDPRYINVSMEQLDDFKPMCEDELIQKISLLKAKNYV